MPRYIDVDKLNWYDDLFMKGINNSGVWVRYRDVENFIKNAPTADVVEVRHGEWLENGANYKCSVCGNTESYYTDSYCRCCGAKMDGEEIGLDE